MGAVWAVVFIMHNELKKSLFFQSGVLSVLLFSCIMISRKKNLHFFQTQGAVRAVVLIMQNELKKSLIFQSGVLSELLFSICIMSSRKIYFFPILGCCLSCCSNNPFSCRMWTILIFLLKNYERIHTVDISFNCSKCDKKFKDSNALRHMKEFRLLRNHSVVPSVTTNA